MDHGVEGLNDTIKFLNQLNIPFTGAGNDIKDASRSLSFETNGIRLAVIAFCHDEGPMASNHSPGPCPLPDTKEICTRIRKLSAEHDLVILSYHGGEEFFTIPWRTRIKMFHEFVNAGANIVYGHHAHVTQGFELYKGVPILYGAGNFYMDTPYQRANPESQFGAVFDIVFANKSKTFEISYAPIRSCLESNNVEMAASEDKKIIDDTIRLSCRSLNDSSFHAEEWNRQAIRRFKGRFGFPGIAYRMFKFYWNRQLYITNDTLLLSAKRDTDIFKGALNHFKSNFIGG
jgi:poly-gamma-glutamate synthesis protein (capsule biosynthesis protein)